MFNYSTTIDSIRSFLSMHPVPDGKKYALVMDNAPWHKKTMRLVEQEVVPEYEDIRNSVVFILVIEKICQITDEQSDVYIVI